MASKPSPSRVPPADCADMDAVRSEVVGDQPYRSQVPGVKHVCGHDAHVAVGLGVAEVLASMRAELRGTVKLLFQPAEENVQGARAMIADGVLEAPTPTAMFALHTAPFPVGAIGVGPGVGLTGWDPFTVVGAMGASSAVICAVALPFVDLAWLGTTSGVVMAFWLGLATISTAYVLFTWGLSGLTAANTARAACSRSSSMIRSSFQ